MPYHLCHIIIKIYFILYLKCCLPHIPSKIQIPLIKKHASPIQLPRPSIFRGGLFFCFIFLHNRHMNILQRIFTDYYEEIKYTLHPSLTPYVFLLCPYQEPYYQTFCSSYDHLNQIQYLRFQR